MNVSPGGSLGGGEGIHWILIMIKDSSQTHWIHSPEFPLDLQKWEYTCKTSKYHGILKNLINIMESSKALQTVFIHHELRSFDDVGPDSPGVRPGPSSWWLRGHLHVENTQESN